MEGVIIKTEKLLNEEIENENIILEVLAKQDHTQKPITEFWLNKYEEDAAKNWNLFYKRHENRAYKLRHWTLDEFNELKDALEVASKDENQMIRLFEIGCGNGSTVFPLIKECVKGSIYITAVDCAQTAIEICHQHELYDEKYCDIKVCDIVLQPFPYLEKHHFCTLLFVLSAISPSNFPLVMNKIYNTLLPGGIIYFRDYAKYDMAQLRFKARSKLGENFYVRQDSTRSYFFSREEVIELMEKCGFETIYCLYCKKKQKLNKNNNTAIKYDTVMLQRRWLQAAFRRPLVSKVNE